MAAAFLAGVLGAGDVSAQQDTHPPPDSVQLELARLQAQIDSLRALLLRTRADRAAGETADTSRAEVLARLRALAAAAAGAQEPEEDRTQAFQGRQRALQALNPEISIGGDFLSLWDETHHDGSGFLLREVEFAFQATLDPFSRAKIIASHHEHGGGMEPFPAADGSQEEHVHEPAVAVEEAYAQWVDLPGGFALTVGRFRQRLGTYNRWHRHALPWSGLPLPYTVFLGDEGLSQTGASLYWLAPVGGVGTYEVWVESTRSGNETLFGQGDGLSLLGHVNAFLDLSPSTYLELSVSGVGGDYELEGQQLGRRLVHMEAGLSWRPPGRERYREVTIRGALLRTRGPDPAATGTLAPRTVTGGFGFIETRLGWSWLAGLRYDHVTDPSAPDQHAWMLVPTLTWWQSEFVRIRGEYDWLHAPAGTQGQLVVQLSFAMGPHKHETY
jgi:hypothetical protein